MNVFEERQTPPAWVRVLLLPMIVVPACGIWQQMFQGRSFGNNPMSNRGLIIVAIALFLLFAVLWSIRLETRVSSGELSVRLWPFVRRRVPLAGIASCEARTYDPLGEYWGWGWRRGARGDTAYTMKGNRGVQIRLTNGESLLVGSRRPEELAAALRRSA